MLEKISNFTLLFLLIFFASDCLAQTPDSISPGVEIKVLARVQKDRISLRWAVTEAYSWKKLNLYGYRLERFTIMRNDIILEKPERVVLVSVLKPAPVEEWQSIIEDNDSGAILAQAIYGESFEVTGGNTLQSVVNQSQEMEQRFTFALFSADNDFEMAKKAGLGYDDRTAKPNEKYMYRVSSLVPVAESAIKYGGAYVGLSQYEDLPKPMDFAGFFTDSSTTLSWNFKILSHVYTSYYIERAFDTQPFERITNKPYTSMNQENENSSIIYYTDSITNNKSYSYRIQGISTFGELGPYSDIVSGTGKEFLKFAPNLTIKEFIDDKTVKLTWEFDEKGNELISGFELSRSDDDKDDNFVTVIKDIPPINRTITYNKLNAANYFIVTAVGKQGEKRKSFPMFVQPEDSIPPVRPVNLKGIAENSGVINITWDANKEEDLMGYRIYRANNPDEEYSQLTVSPEQPNIYKDSVEIKSLNSKVYYKVIAVDRRYNMSPFSEVLIVKKPDIIPPISPVFTSYEAKDNSILLEWINSQSEDVASHQLYRKVNEEKDWDLVFDNNKKHESYEDKDVLGGNTYRYAIYAKDESGLVSQPSPQIALLMPKSAVMPPIKSFYAQANQKTRSIDLSWRYTSEGVENFEIYKSTADEPMQLMQVVLASINRISDPTLTINTKYRYGIRALFKDGRVSKMQYFEIKY